MKDGRKVQPAFDDGIELKAAMRFASNLEPLSIGHVPGL